MHLKSEFVCSESISSHLLTLNDPEIWGFAQKMQGLSQRSRPVLWQNPSADPLFLRKKGLKGLIFIAGVIILNNHQRKWS